MPPKKQPAKRASKRPIESYDHRDKERVNNPPVGLVTPETDPDAPQKRTYAYDPHIDPSLSFDQQAGRKLIEERYANLRALLSAADAAAQAVRSAREEGASSQELKRLHLQADDLLRRAREAAVALEKPQLPYLNWAGKAEHTSFEVPTVSLHVHERIEPRTILEAVRKRNGEAAQQPSFFEMDERPLREAIEFYKHKDEWSNRLIAGDSLLVMNSLIEKEGLAGKVQMIYIDPPYGIEYKSNFQPFVNKRDVTDGKDEDLTAEPEQIRAFRDTWELGIHSYLTYLRDRLLLALELLTESGSVFVQIGDENVHLVRCLLDEVFGTSKFVAQVRFRKKTMPLGGKFLERMGDYLIWYAKDKQAASQAYKQLFVQQDYSEDFHWSNYELADGSRHRITKEQGESDLPLPHGARRFRLVSLWPASFNPNAVFAVHFRGREWWPADGQCWPTSPENMQRLAKANQLEPEGKYLRKILYSEGADWAKLTTDWQDTIGARGQTYVVETSHAVVQRCLLMTTDPGDLVLDPTCGSGTTAYVAEQWGRRWITCDTSRVALTLARQRLMTAVFDYYDLEHPEEGVASGFKYKKVPHTSLETIANDPGIDAVAAKYQPQIDEARAALNRELKQKWEEWEVPRGPDAPPTEARKAFDRFWSLKSLMRAGIDLSIQSSGKPQTLYNQPLLDNKRTRVSGPFTVEAVPAPVVKSVEELLEDAPRPADASIARSGETLRQGEWRDELLKTGIRAKAGQRIRFARLEPLAGCRWLHADGETRPSAEGADSVREDAPAYQPMRAVTSFGPDHAPMEQRQVARAIEEAQTLVPRPKLLIFAAFQFDPEAAKDIDETQWPGLTLLKAQMNADLLTDDLKKKRTSNESFWLIGQPDVQVERIKEGPDEGKYRVSVHGFDYYNTKTGLLESGGSDRIAVWLLDTDYDGRSLYPRQVFFPIAGEDEGWAGLAKNLKAEVDETLIEAYWGTESLPFGPGEHKRAAVKILDDRGIESLKILELD